MLDWKQYVPDYSSVPPGFYQNKKYITLPTMIDPAVREDMLYVTTTTTAGNYVPAYITGTITIPYHTQPGASTTIASTPNLTLLFNRAYFDSFLHTHLSGKYLRFKNILEGTERIIEKEEALKFAFQFFQSMGIPSYKSHEDLCYKDDEWELTFERAVTSEQLLEEITLD